MNDVFDCAHIEALKAAASAGSMTEQEVKDQLCEIILPKIHAKLQAQYDSLQAAIRQLSEES